MITKVKICGIRDLATALGAAAAGADLLGMVFAPSRRLITPELAVHIVHAVRESQPCPKLVGVFANTPGVEVDHLAEQCALDYVQLSGGESVDYCLSVKRPVIKVVHVSADSTAAVILAKMEREFKVLGKNVIFLLDTGQSGVYGGTGKTFDWAIAKDAAASFPVIVAGGLTPENVGKLVQEVHPWGVDVSSGVERNGRKDIAKIGEFIKAVKQNGKTKT